MMVETATITELRKESVLEEEGLYAELKRLVEEKGLFKRQYHYYRFKISITFGLLVLGWVALILIDNVWLRMLDAAFAAFIAVQVGFIGHDAGHQQIFRASWKNDLLGLLNGFSLGASYSWWVDTHNRHHGRPNQISFDPAINYSIIAFSEEQALEKTGFARFIVKYQAFLFIPMLMLYPLSMRIDSLRYLLRERSRYRALEICSVLLYFPLYLLFLFLLMNVWEAILFAVIHQVLFGLYISSVFVPNHMGMPIVNANENPDFLRQQVLTSRNVKGHPLVDFLFGGLNYQIEHHLFPKMPRNRLRTARKLVQEFLQQKSIAYHETGFIQSFREILADLHRVSKSI
jgi:fatty acid desaturase